MASWNKAQEEDQEEEDNVNYMNYDDCVCVCWLVINWQIEHGPLGLVQERTNLLIAVLVVSGGGALAKWCTHTQIALKTFTAMTDWVNGPSLVNWFVQMESHTQVPQGTTHNYSIANQLDRAPVITERRLIPKCQVYANQ